MTLIAAADGSALGNPGPAGWGWYIDEHRWASGGWPHGTNNMGELTAVLDLLRQTDGSDEDLVVYCDSTYVINSITKWMPGWKRKNWRKGDGKPVQNVEIMKALDAAMAGRRVRFEWVRGHAGHELNEEADRLANAAALAFSHGRRPDPGPGFAGVRRPAESHSDYRPTSKGQPEADLFSELDEGGLDEGGLDEGGFDRGAMGGAAMDEKGGPSDEERVVALERDLLRDEVRADRAAVAALLHPQWTEIGRSGRLWTRDEMLDAIGPLSEPVTLDTLAVQRIDPTTILLIWRAVSDERSTLRSSVWVRDGGDWRQRFHQGTDEA